LTMRVLVIGAGGREHAICWSLSASSMIDELYAAPGSDAMGADVKRVPLAVDDLDDLVAFCLEKRIDLVVPGPELPLVLGIRDRLDEAGIKCFGPSAKAAQLEGSKAFTKALCRRYQIPTAACEVFGKGDMEQARAYVRDKGAPIVIKADGLAAGKGVTVAMSLDEAITALDEAEDGAFGSAGQQVVVEEYLEGEEASFFALVDGDQILSFGTAQDHKAVGEGDTGPNTGGMGAYSPAPCMTDALIQRTMDEIVRPTILGMIKDGAPYRGILYAGLMITKDGPKLIEYNARFGDPECQVLLPRLMTDLCQLFLGGVDGMLGNMDLRWRPVHSMTVVMAAKGYPGTYQKGSEIRGIDQAETIDGVTVFHAGTRIEDGRVFANGGRVLNITAEGETLSQARERAYRAVDLIDWQDGFCRRDIGWRALGINKLEC